VEVRSGPIETSKAIQSYGVIDGGGETMRYAWSRLTHKFSVRRQSEKAACVDLLPKPKPQIFVGHNRYRKDLLEKCPVDLLVVERGTFHHPPTSLERRHLYPFLYQRQVLGDPYLTPYSGGRGNSIEEKFWSLHCYRRGARSHVSRGGKFGHHRFKQATQAQVYEHARWRYRRSSEAIDVIYREWNPVDRIQITLNCH
jgi:hypothetical protein